MSALELLADLERRGVTVREDSGDLVLGPADALRGVDLDRVKAAKPDILAALKRRALGVDWTKASLYQLDRVLEVAVPWSDVRLVIAPGCRIARELRATDPKPGRVWCVCEVLYLLLTGVTPEDAGKIAETRITFDAEWEGIRHEGEDGSR